jgi:hypothetical protein
LATTKVDVNLIDASSIGDTKYLKGDGTWGTVDALPSQTSQSGKFLTTDGSDASWATAGGLFSSYALIVDSKAEGVDGGTFTLGAWRTRDLNTTIANTDTTNITLGTNEFTLLAGNYLIKWVCPVFGVARHKSRLYDVTGTAGIQNGMAAYAAADSCGAARVTPSGSNVYRIEHWCLTTYASIGFGAPTGTGTGVEVYAQVEIFKES